MKTMIRRVNGSYNALDVNYTHRVSQGLTLLASYTFSKFLDNVGGPEYLGQCLRQLFGEHSQRL